MPIDQTFVDAIQSVPPQPAQILPSEMLFFCELCRRDDVKVVVESGRKHGYSTECLAKCGFQVHSIDLEPLDDDARFDFPHVTLHAGDGRTLVPELIGQQMERTAVLLDGPKSHEAFALLDQIRPHIVWCGIHDLHWFREGNGVNPARAEAERRGDGCLSDDASWTGCWSWLDEAALEFNNYQNRNDLCQYGNVLGMFRGGVE